MSSAAESSRPQPQISTESFRIAMLDDHDNEICATDDPAIVALRGAILNLAKVTESHSLQIVDE